MYYKYYNYSLAPGLGLILVLCRNAQSLPPSLEFHLAHTVDDIMLT